MCGEVSSSDFRLWGWSPAKTHSSHSIHSVFIEFWWKECLRFLLDPHDAGNSVWSCVPGAPWYFPRLSLERNKWPDSLFCGNDEKGLAPANLNVGKFLSHATRVRKTFQVLSQCWISPGTTKCSLTFILYIFCSQIQGEIFSFYLSRLLGFGNVPPASLDLVEVGGPQWDRIRPELTLAQWMEQRPVVMTQWVDGLEPAHIPAPFRPSSRHLHPPDVNLQVCTYQIIFHKKKEIS